MDARLYSEILEYKTNATYPSGYSRNDKTNFRRNANTFDVQDGKLFYKKKGNSIEVVCGSEKAAEIFKDFHASSTGAHCGQKKTRDAISKRFYWPGMSEDIDTWVAQCMECQASGIQIKEEKSYNPIIVTHPFELIGMDLIGKLTKTKEGNSYICVMIDYLTKWLQAYPLKTRRAEEVADCILNFYYQFEAPKRILTDQGKEFVNVINTNIRKILGIKRSLCAPYHPQTNGLVEKMNGTVQRSLRKLVGERPDTWDQHLNAAMFGLRTKTQLTTKFSPFYMMFGREARYPSQVPEEFMVDSSVEAIVENDSPTDDVLRLRDALQAARDNISKGNQDKSADLQNEEGRAFPKINIDHLKKDVEQKPQISHKILNSSASTTSTSVKNSTPAANSASMSIPGTTSAPVSTTSASSSSSASAATSAPVSTTAATSAPVSTTAATSALVSTTAVTSALVSTTAVTSALVSITAVTSALVSTTAVTSALVSTTAVTSALVSITAATSVPVPTTAATSATVSTIAAPSASSSLSV